MFSDANEESTRKLNVLKHISIARVLAPLFGCGKKEAFSTRPWLADEKDKQDPSFLYNSSDMTSQPVNTFLMSFSYSLK